MAELRRALADARLVTIVGPGGVGKTRLATRIATDLERGFPHGAWWVDLAEVRDAAMVTEAVQAGLELRGQSAAQTTRALASTLRERELLIVLDNCEQVLAPAALLVSDVLRVAPGVRVLATSREPLQVAGERVVPLPPLELPTQDSGQGPAELRHNEAVALFTERAAAASGTFELTDANQAAVVDLCRRLDGLPLAIELAAVRTRHLSAEQILERLTDRFALLTGGGHAALPRHQTLRTTIDWSYDLLSAPEQQLMRRLAVFAGRFTIDDGESVCSFDRPSADWVLDAMAALVDKSLVTKEEFAGIACYRLHETMRDYASDRLREAGEGDQLDEAYVDYYGTRFQELRAALLHDIQTILHSGDSAGHRTVGWLNLVELEMDNIRAALNKCLAASDWQRGLELATSIGYYWVTRGSTESLRWFDDLLRVAEDSHAIPPRAFYFRGWLGMLTNDVEGTRASLQRAIDASRVEKQPEQLSESLSAASILAHLSGDSDMAAERLREAEAITLGLAHYPASMALLQARAVHALFGGDLTSAEAVSDEGARLSRGIGDLYYLEAMLMNLGFVALMHGNRAKSRARLAEGLRIARDTDNRAGQSTLLRLLGAEAATGDPRRAARLFGAGEALASPVGFVGPFETQLARARDATISALGEAAFDAERAAGNDLGRESALRMALGESDDAGIDAVKHVGAGPLARREAEVATLIAEGLSNKQIGARLFISERTVATHVGNILNKLGFDSRAQIASWVAARS
jgi:predicted ATPase/DNA-binding CsgD family transcriptional regulator